MYFTTRLHSGAMLICTCMQICFAHTCRVTQNTAALISHHYVTYKIHHSYFVIVSCSSLNLDRESRDYLLFSDASRNGENKHVKRIQLSNPDIRLDILPDNRIEFKLSPVVIQQYTYIQKVSCKSVEY